jgi:selenocysteine-specific elongation factor
MYVIGTAGHVDHGKSTLVRALTGIDPDRWEEERRREMTIDLGFAWLTLPSGRQVSLIDVPGHERFIKNMLAGVGGLDAALLVIAADESLMPQTQEHLAILDLLDVRHGLVVLTKTDLVDTEWVDLVREEVQQALHGTSLDSAQLVAVSARTGSGLEALQTAIDELLNQTPTRSNAVGQPRMPIDRSFTIGGFGTVVTGTLLDGPLEVGRELEILPRRLPVRVRGLQSHQQQHERALPGSRVAVNLAGIHHREIRRGDVLAPAGTIEPTSMIDLHLRMLPDAPQPLQQNTLLDLFVGAAEVRCRSTLLDSEQLAPGASGWVQLRLEQPIAVIRGDRCIVRQPSPSQTIAGGSIVDPHPARHRRFRSEVIAGLETLARGAPDDLLMRALSVQGVALWEELIEAAGLNPAQARVALGQLIAQQRALLLPGAESAAATGADGLPDQLDGRQIMEQAAWDDLRPHMIAALRSYHKRLPLRRGMPREDLRQRLRLAARSAPSVLRYAAALELVALSETDVRLADFSPQPDAEQRRELDRSLAAMRRTPYTPPTPEIDAELLAWAVQQKLVIPIGADIYFLPEIYQELLEWVRTTITCHGSVGVGQLRDHFGTSRKYALTFLEHLDARKITRREGEGRVLY